MKARFSLIFADVRTGIVLDAAGAWNTSSVRFEPAFHTLSEAIAEKNRLLAAFDSTEVTVVDATGEIETVVYTRAGIRRAGMVGKPGRADLPRPAPLATLLASDPYGPRFAARLRAIAPTLPEDLRSIDQLDPEVGRAAIACALGYACQAQHIANISLGRAALLDAPRAWLLRTLPDIARATLDFADSWEARRLLEVASFVDAALLRSLVGELQSSTNPEVREAASDFEHSA